MTIPPIRFKFTWFAEDRLYYILCYHSITQSLLVFKQPHSLSIGTFLLNGNHMMIWDPFCHSLGIDTALLSFAQHHWALRCGCGIANLPFDVHAMIQWLQMQNHISKSQSCSSCQYQSSPHESLSVPLANSSRRDPPVALSAALGTERTRGASASDGGHAARTAAWCSFRIQRSTCNTKSTH